MLYKLAVNWMIIAFLVRMVACLAVHIYSLEAGFEGFYPLASGNDDDLYWKLADEILSGSIPEYIPNSYPFFLVALFSITGQNLLIGKILSVFAGSLTVYVGVILAHELSSGINLPQQDRNYAANFTGILLTLYPSALWYSTQLVRDLLLVFFAILNIYLSIIILKRGKQSLWIWWGTWIWWGITLFIVYSLRNYAGVGLLMGFFAYLIFIWKVKIQRKLFVLALVLIPCALVPYFLGQGIFGFEHILPTLNTEEIARQREHAYSTGGSSTGISIDYSNPVNFIFTYGQSYITAMLGPLPWQVRSVVTLITLPEVIGMWILYFQLWQSWSSRTIKNKNNEEILLLISCLIQVGIFALFSDNIGANTRLRLLPWISFFIYASIHFAKKRASIRNLS
ncbi:MAG: hypothetical protein V7L05_20325 [Nostoc sp.]|uniref:hypothetical protein n=1 Tax=Nostoc sp. TaxID=1180 RepID=UPI002FFBCADD